LLLVIVPLFVTDWAWPGNGLIENYFETYF